jgi:predicted ribosomally synthesized peptide with nif11-like leader
MSMQNVQEFLNRVADDASLRQQLGDNPTVEQLVSAAKSLGLEITADDVAAAQAGGASAVELSDADLDQVAGGCFLSLIGRKPKDGGEDETPPDTETSGEEEKDTRTTDEKIEDLLSGPLFPPTPPGPLTSKTPLLC